MLFLVIGGGRGGGGVGVVEEIISGYGSLGFGTSVVDFVCRCTYARKRRYWVFWVLMVFVELKAAISCCEEFSKVEW